MTIPILYLSVGILQTFALWVATPQEFNRPKIDYVFAVVLWPILWYLVIDDGIKWEQLKSWLFVKVFFGVLSFSIVALFVAWIMIR